MTPDAIRVRPGEGGRLIVQIPYSPDHVAKIKMVVGRRWHAHERHWSVPHCQETLGALLRLFTGKPVDVDPALGVVNTPNERMSSPARPDSVLVDLHTALQARHYSRRTEQAYGHWVSRFLHFHQGRLPGDMAEAEINRFLTHLAVTKKVSAAVR